MECLALGLLTVAVYIPQTTCTRLRRALSSKDCSCDFVKGAQPHSDLQVEQSNGAPDDYYICN